MHMSQCWQTADPARREMINKLVYASVCGPCILTGDSVDLTIVDKTPPSVRVLHL